MPKFVESVCKVLSRGMNCLICWWQLVQISHLEDGLVLQLGQKPAVGGLFCCRAPVHEDTHGPAFESGVAGAIMLGLVIRVL